MKKLSSTQVLIVLFPLVSLISCTKPMDQTIPLYNEIPNSKPVKDEEILEQRDGITIISKITRPTLSIYKPDTGANGTAIIICPGGGYWINAVSHEGADVARAFNEMGVTAFVLKYRIPNDATMHNKEIGPLQDVQQAISLVRKNSSLYNINPNKIGVMGFSAGGHLASLAGTHFHDPVIETDVSVRPDFLVLIYPVISFSDSIGHIGSRDQLLGKNPSPEKITLFSTDQQVNANTPPSFLVHALDDDAVRADNSKAFYQSLVRNNVKAEIHLYPHGGHGFGMNNATTSDAWMDRCRSWLDANGWIKH